MVTLLHTADWQIDDKNEKKVCYSLDQILEYCQLIKVDHLLNAGDLSETPRMFKSETGVDKLFYYLDALSRLVKYISIVKGNNHHDAPGSVSLLHNIRPNILAYEQPAMLAFMPEPVDLFRDESTLQEIAAGSVKEPEIIISLMPYPTKGAFITNQSIDANNKDFGEIFDGLMISFGMLNDKFKCPKVMGFHGNLLGAALSNGQKLLGQDVIIAPSSLQKANCDYYGLGHIHMYQKILSNMIYSGNTANRNWGEIEQKSFQVVRFDNGEMEIERIMLKGSRPMVEVLAEFKDGKIVYDAEIPENAEVRIRCKVAEDENCLLTNEKKDEFTRQLGADKQVRFDPEIVPNKRESRSETIMEAKTLEEEVSEYARVTGQEVTKSILAKVDWVRQKAAELAAVSE